MGPNNWGIFLFLPATNGEGIGPSGGNFPSSLYVKKWPMGDLHIDTALTSFVIRRIMNIAFRTSYHVFRCNGVIQNLLNISRIII